MPDRGVDRPPFPDEVAARPPLRHPAAPGDRRSGTRRIDKRTPGGRFDGRAYARGRAAARRRAPGHHAPVADHPPDQRAAIQEPHVALIIDTSGSMAAYEYALGPIAWILTDGLRQIGGRCATALFGNSAELLTDGRRPLAHVPGDPHRRRHRVRRRRDRARRRPARDDQPAPPALRLRRLATAAGTTPAPASRRSAGSPSHGVPTIHLAIGIAPLSVEADRIIVITDPADALDHIAADTVAALAGRHAPRRARPEPHTKGAPTCPTPTPPC